MGTSFWTQPPLTSFNTELSAARLHSNGRRHVPKNTVIAFQWIVRQISKTLNVITETYHCLEKFENLLGGDKGLSFLKTNLLSSRFCQPHHKSAKFHGAMNLSCITQNLYGNVTINYNNSKYGKKLI